MEEATNPLLLETKIKECGILEDLVQQLTTSFNYIHFMYLFRETTLPLLVISANKSFCFLFVSLFVSYRIHILCLHLCGLGFVETS